MRYIFKTNLKCSGCVVKVEPLLNNAKEIIRWSIDLNHPDKLLTVELEIASPELIVEIFREAGYKAELR